MEPNRVHRGLPNDIIICQILARLQTKFVHHCRCVCKSWSSLTRSPYFLSLHRSFRCSPCTHLLFTTSDEAASSNQHFLSVKLNQGEKDFINPATNLFSVPSPCFSFLGGTHSINGLTILADQFSAKPVYIFNPCTEEFITLPRTSMVAQPSTHHLGYSAVTNEYKVLQVYWSSSRNPRFKIFSLGSTSWRNIDLNYFPFNFRGLDFANRSVSLHGGIHWMHRDQKVIVVFDVGAERFRANIQLPRDCNSRNVVEVGGCVAVYDPEVLIQQDIMLLWILEDYQNRVWVQKSIIFPSSYKQLGCPIPLGTIHTGELLLNPTIRVSDTRNISVHLYNVQNGCFRKLRISLPVKTAVWNLLTSCDGTHGSVVSLRLLDDL